MAADIEDYHAEDMDNDVVRTFQLISVYVHLNLLLSSHSVTDICIGIARILVSITCLEDTTSSEVNIVGQTCSVHIGSSFSKITMGIKCYQLFSWRVRMDGHPVPCHLVYPLTVWSLFSHFVAEFIESEIARDPTRYLLPWTGFEHLTSWLTVEDANHETIMYPYLHDFILMQL